MAMSNQVLCSNNVGLDQKVFSISTFQKFPKVHWVKTYRHRMPQKSFLPLVMCRKRDMCRVLKVGLLNRHLLNLEKQNMLSKAFHNQKLNCHLTIPQKNCSR